MEDAWVSSEGGKRWECEAGDGRGGEGKACQESVVCP